VSLSLESTCLRSFDEYTKQDKHLQPDQLVHIRPPKSTCPSPVLDKIAPPRRPHQGPCLYAIFALAAVVSPSLDFVPLPLILNQFTLDLVILPSVLSPRNAERR
jgi:hypothetical protein